MFPIPIISNTSKLPISESDRLYSEMVSSGYPKIPAWNWLPRDISSLYVWAQGDIMVNSQSFIMYGSPYGSNFTSDSRYSTIILHVCPNLDVWNFYKNNPDTPFYLRRTEIMSYPSYTSISRNGYTSLSYSAFNGCTCDLFVYIDPISLRAMKYNPLLMTTPTRYYED